MPLSRPIVFMNEREIHFKKEYKTEKPFKITCKYCVLSSLPDKLMNDARKILLRFLIGGSIISRPTLTLLNLQT